MRQQTKLEEIASEQEWDDETINIHLMGFIESRNLENDLVDYLVKVADEENAEAETLSQTC